MICNFSGPAANCNTWFKRKSALFIHSLQVRGRDVAQEGQLRCGFRSADGSPIHVRMIKPSVMWFTMRNDVNEITSVSEDSSFVRLCYPTHSSCSEIQDLIKYLKPMQAFPNVIPFGSSKEKVSKFFSLIQAWISRFKTPNTKMSMPGREHLLSIRIRAGLRSYEVWGKWT